MSICVDILFQTKGVIDVHRHYQNFKICVDRVKRE